MLILYTILFLSLNLKYITQNVYYLFKSRSYQSSILDHLSQIDETYRIIDKYSKINFDDSFFVLGRKLT